MRKGTRVGGVSDVLARSKTWCVQDRERKVSLSWLERSPVGDRQESRAIAKGRSEGQHLMARAKTDIYTLENEWGEPEKKEQLEPGPGEKGREKKRLGKGSYGSFWQSFV